MVEPNSSSDSDREKLRALEAENLITDDPYPSHQRRRAARRAKEALRWLKENPEWSGLVKDIRKPKK